MTDKEQRLLLIGRETLEISGVTAVDSFDNERIELTTSLGGLDIVGEGLVIDTLNLTEGQVNISGAINAMQYGKSRAEKSARYMGKSIVNRLLR